MRKSFMNGRVLRFHACALESRLMLSVSPTSEIDTVPEIDFDTVLSGTLLEDAAWTDANQDEALQVLQDESLDGTVSSGHDGQVDRPPIPAIPFDDSVTPIHECPDLESEFCLPGDATRDGSVDFMDFLLLNRNYGIENARWEDGDFDGDGRVGFSDLLLLAARFSG